MAGQNFYSIMTCAYRLRLQFNCPIDPFLSYSLNHITDISHLEPFWTVIHFSDRQNALPIHTFLCDNGFLLAGYSIVTEQHHFRGSHLRRESEWPLLYTFLPARRWSCDKSPSPKKKTLKSRHRKAMDIQARFQSYLCKVKKVYSDKCT